MKEYILAIWRGRVLQRVVALADNLLLLSAGRSLCNATSRFPLSIANVTTNGENSEPRISDHRKVRALLQ